MFQHSCTNAMMMMAMAVRKKIMTIVVNYWALPKQMEPWISSSWRKVLNGTKEYKGAQNEQHTSHEKASIYQWSN